MRIVIKVGTSTLAHATGQLNIRLIERLCRVIADIKNSEMKGAKINNEVSICCETCLDNRCLSSHTADKRG